MDCPHCGTEYDENEVVCPDCGRTAYVPKNRRGSSDERDEAPAEPQAGAGSAEGTGAGPAEAEGAGDQGGESGGIFPRPVGVQVKADGSWSVGPETPAAMPRRSARSRPEILRTDGLLGKPPPADIPQALVKSAQDELERAAPLPRPTSRIRLPVARDEIPAAEPTPTPAAPGPEAAAGADAGSGAEAPRPDEVSEVDEDAAGSWEAMAPSDGGDDAAGPDEGGTGADEPRMSVADALADSLGQAPADGPAPTSASVAGAVTPEPVADGEPAEPGSSAEAGDEDTAAEASDAGPQADAELPADAAPALATEGGAVRFATASDAAPAGSAGGEDEVAAPDDGGAVAKPAEQVRTVPIQAAGFWWRLVALAVDAVPLLLIAVILYYPIAWLMPLPDFPPAREHGIDFLVDLALREPILLLPPGLALVLGFLIYHTALEGRTAGRRLLGLSVVGLDGEAISRPRELLRSLLVLLFGALFGLGLLWVGFDRERRGLHDRLARTVVAVGQARGRSVDRPRNARVPLLTPGPAPRPRP